MISRRLLRQKVMHVLYSSYKNDVESIAKAEKELFFSIGKTYDLYHYLLLLVVDLNVLAERKIEKAKEKYLPSQEDLNPNTKFIDNKFIKQLSSNIQLNSYAEINGINWTDENDFLSNIYNRFIESEAFVSYMESDKSSYSEDKKIIMTLFSHILPSSELFYSVMEDKCIYWNDDIDFVLSMVLKTLKSMTDTDSEHEALMPIFKDSADEEFARQLLRKTLLSHEENVLLVSNNTVNWDVERIAFMDVVVMEMAITELKEFSSIPTKVTLNEYLEMSKYYSTMKSSKFINGVLDKIVVDLTKTGDIKKAGRGLAS